jgi:medium-chain acyl-[acyl-carrier-protein] hydrolase
MRLYVPSENPGAQIRLFCFHYAGGGVTLFRDWPARLPADVELCALELPGHDGLITQAPLTRMQPLVERAVQTVAGHLNLPFALFGHSMGSLIAFELARRLRLQHLPQPALLFASGHRAPHLPDRRSPVHQLPDAAFIEALRELGGTPSMVLENQELMELFLPVLRADFTLCETYEFVEREPLPCRIVAFGGARDPDIPIEDIEAWSKHAAGGFDRHLLDADHFFLHSAQDELLTKIRDELAHLYSSRCRRAIRPVERPFPP